ncbi:mechanosensitive ion channel family protein [Gemmobacter serpentinus]|uniref:mechanosensitive ion channel family protein n=1 Tax=Gemmobacter serpentinus TaxID=2652247 RepID=UPI00124BE97D|nr:mechanosensitive ion channel domain-containing protein [Gemmobacter serpentinus]
MANDTNLVTILNDWVGPTLDTAKGWLVSPAAWSQFALLVVAFLLARMLTARLRPILHQMLSPSEGKGGPLASARIWARGLLPLLLPLLAFGLTAFGEEITRSLFGSGAVIAFGKRVFLFLAARILVQEVLTDRFLRFLGRFILIPAMLLYALGLLDDINAHLEATSVSLGNIRFSVMALIRGGIAAAVLFWLGSWSNRQSADYIKKQDELRPATRELAMKAAEVGIFGAAFLLLMSIMGIDLTAVAVLGGALGVGVGLGLQQIAANFVSGIILLLEGQTTVGDYVELDGGEKGTIVRMTARACVLETFDGKWIVVPNEHFITTRVVNYSDQGSANRYEQEFTVSYDTDPHIVPGLIEAELAKLSFILTDPDHEAECELRGFGDKGLIFGVKYWVNGIDDGKNNFGHPVLLAIWTALKQGGIEMPFPQHVVHMKQGTPA